MSGRRGCALAAGAVLAGTGWLGGSLASGTAASGDIDPSPGTGMARMHEQMMSRHPDMAQLHDRMVEEHPEMGCMRDGMMSMDSMTLTTSPRGPAPPLPDDEPP